MLRTIARERRRLTRARSGLGVPRPHARYNTITHRSTVQLIEEETHAPFIDAEATVPLQRLLVAAGAAKPAMLHEPAALHEVEG